MPLMSPDPRLKLGTIRPPSIIFHSFFTQTVQRVDAAVTPGVHDGFTNKGDTRPNVPGPFKRRIPMTSTAQHQNAPIIVSNSAYSRNAHQIRSDYLAESVAALCKSIREILIACTNHLKTQA
jgi:hypothetical protein